MFLTKSRYSKARPFERRADGSEVFAGIRAREIGAASGVIEHEIQSGDRLDLLARHYYNNDRLWWRILDANPEFFYGQRLQRVAHKDATGTTVSDKERIERAERMFPEVMLCEALEGSVLLIPKAKE